MIGIYDSGLGGLSVMQAVRELLPQHDLAYLADTAYCPYGPRSRTQVQARALACASWLVERGAQVVVVACNTASSAALELLRAALPVPIVGMEPGVKPAALQTHTRRVAVLATGGTLAGQRYARLIERFGGDVTVEAVPCPRMVEQVEAGDLDSPQTQAIVAAYLAPLLANGVDTLVLGCTHFNFLAALIGKLAGPAVTIINTAPAVARRVQHVTQQQGVLSGSGALHMGTTGNPTQVGPLMSQLWGAPLVVTWATC
jgi:glutamate racemase